MARYILIDNNSGFIFGDSADHQGEIFDGTAVEFAKAVDEDIGEYGRSYSELDSCNDTTTGYHVYRADINGSDAIVTIEDGQDQEMIDAVESDCDYLGFIAVTGP
jgi:hypothetical protein